jgi:diguanylate cyclase (GGDEF)-like protein
VLKELAARASLMLRQYDSFARYGGEEFLIIMPGASAESCFSAAERLRASIRGEPFNIDSGQIQVTASFGVAGFDLKESADSLIGRADAALYKAKQNGRDRVELLK